MPGGFQPYGAPKSHWTMLVECSHGFQFRVDLAYVKAPRRLIDECPMAQLETELGESGQRRVLRRLAKRGLGGSSTPDR